MKHLKISMTATIVVAVLFSCGNHQENGKSDSTRTDSSSAGHEHHGSSNATDTTAIKEGQSVYFENLKDGQEIPGNYEVKFGVKGMTTDSAKHGVQADKGHHHLLIDTVGFIPAGEMIAKVPGRFEHFGNGQSSFKLNLKPGMHKISLQFANGLHQSYGMRMSKTIEVKVK